MDRESVRWHVVLGAATAVAAVAFGAWLWSFAGASSDRENYQRFAFVMVHGNFENARSLARGLPSVDHEPYGGTVLEWIGPRPDAIEFAVDELGSDPNASDDNGETALISFAKMKPDRLREAGITPTEHRRAIAVLLDHGADACHRSRNGDLPSELAEHRRLPAVVVQMLTEAESAAGCGP